MKKTLNEQILKESTSNFNSYDNLPLLVFLTDDEVFYDMTHDEKYPQEEDFETSDEWEDAREKFEQEYYDKLNVCVLSDYDVDELKFNLDDLNAKLTDIANDLDEKAYGEEDTEKSTELNNQASYLEDIRFSIEPGYYSGAQIYVENAKEFSELDEEYKKIILDSLKEIKKEFNLTQLNVAYTFSNGETGYNIVKEDCNKPLKEAVVIYKENGKFKGTTKDNYEAQIRDAHKITDFSDFESFEQIQKYLVKYSCGALKNCEVIDKTKDDIKEEKKTKKVKTYTCGNPEKEIQMFNHSTDANSDVSATISEAVCENRVKAFNDALRLAKKENAPIVYGYTTKKNPGKFYSIEMKKYDMLDSKFRKQYGANIIYVAYPDKDFIEEECKKDKGE